MVWILFFPLMILCMIVCYITNPIVALFADDNGELHGFLHMWQTWDDSLDSKFMMTEVVPDKYPKLDYNYNEKYTFWEDTETLKRYNAVICKSTLKPGVKLTTKEKFQRYLCRVLWIMRNCAYGFAYYIFSATGKIEDLKFLANKDYGNGNHFVFAYDTSKNFLVCPWTCRFYIHLVGKLHITGYCGWKIPFWHEQGEYRAMIANRIVPRFKPNT